MFNSITPIDFAIEQPQTDCKFITSDDVILYYSRWDLGKIDYFRAFIGPTFSASAKTVKPIDKPKATLNTIFNHIYFMSNRNRYTLINDDNLFALLAAADEFMLDTLTADCAGYIEFMVKQGRRTAWLMMNSDKYPAAVNAIKKFVDDNTSEFCKKIFADPDFKTFTVDTLNLYINDWGTTLKIMLKWVQADESNAEHVETFFSKYDLTVWTNAQDRLNMFELAQYCANHEVARRALDGILVQLMYNGDVSKMPARKYKKRRIEVSDETDTEP